MSLDRERQQPLQVLISDLTRIVQRIRAGDGDERNELGDLIEEFDSRFTALQNELSRADYAHKTLEPSKTMEIEDSATRVIIVDAMHELNTELQRCMEVLARRMKAVENRLSGFRRCHKALQAYGLKGGGRS